MRASVVIPAFNDQAGIDAALTALARQTLAAAQFEVIIVDNGSSPPLVVRHTTPLAVRLIHCATPGSYAARNAGAAVATGDVLAFTDADCRPAPHWLQRGVARIDAEPGVIVGGNVVLDPPAGGNAVAWYQCVTGFAQHDNVAGRGFAATANLLCARDTFRMAGDFDERLLSGGDLEWCRRAGQRGAKLVFAADVTVRTTPRQRLGAAIRQARRVTAGRRHLRALGLATQPGAAAQPRRGAWQALVFLAAQRQLAWPLRLRVLGVAAIIRLATAIESLRLACGGAAERR